MSNLIETIIKKINENGEYFRARKKYGLKIFTLVIILLLVFFYAFYKFNENFSHTFSTRVSDILTVVVVFIPVLIVGLVALANNRKIQVSSEAIIVWKTSFLGKDIQEVNVGKNMLKSIDVFLSRFGKVKRISSTNLLHGVQKAPIKVRLLKIDGENYTYLFNGRQKYAFLLSLKNCGYTQVNQIGNNKPIEEWPL